MRSSLRCRVTLLALVALLAQILPPAMPLAAQSDDPIAIPIEEPLPEPPAPEPAPLSDETPVTHPALPGLAIDIVLDTPEILVGTPLTVTIQVANRAPHPADEVVLTLPRPADVVPADPTDPAITADGWRWPLGQLAGETTRTITVVLTVATAPVDDALLLEPFVTALGLAEPLRGVGGGIVDPWSAEPTPAQSTPTGSDA